MLKEILVFSEPVFFSLKKNQIVFYQGWKNINDSAVMESANGSCAFWYVGFSGGTSFQGERVEVFFPP